MKKNPGRRNLRFTQRKNRTQLSEKKKAVNERLQLWRSNWLTRHKKCQNFNKIFPEYAKEA